jgi:hypothetical protein
VVIAPHQEVGKPTVNRILISRGRKQIEWEEENGSFFGVIAKWSMCEHLAVLDSL